ncbi:MAG: cytochrome c biogenesis protein CcsA [Capsulimonadaceae bacterium]|nr:cytochrome c biogenesis protein CcsA [Capsulimonadaceae bacterium]
MNHGSQLIAASIAYLTSAVLYASLVLGAHPERTRLRLSIARFAGLAGIFLHTASIGTRCLVTHHTPVSTPPDLMSAIGWSVAIAYLILDTLRRERSLAALGALAFSVSFLCVFCSSVLRLALPSPGPSVAELDSSVVSLHVIAVMLAFAFLILAVASASIYLFEHSLLKRKKIVGGLFSRLPPLATLDALSLTMISHAFPLLTIGCIAGTIRAVASHLPLADSHTLLSVATWAILGIYLMMRMYSIGTSVRANYLLIAALLAAMLTYLAPNQIHHFS